MFTRPPRRQSQTQGGSGRFALMPCIVGFLRNWTFFVQFSGRPTIPCGPGPAGGLTKVPPGPRADMKKSRDDLFIERYIECQSGLYRFIATLVPNRADAEELFQEASLTAWRIRDRFDPLREASPWLCGIARNLVAAHYRKQKSLALTLDPDVLERLGQQQMEEDAVLGERARALNQCLEKLPDRQRDLVRQYYHSDQTVQSFSRARGRSAEAVYKMIQRVRMTLFECVNQTLKRGELA